MILCFPSSPSNGLFLPTISESIKELNRASRSDVYIAVQTERGKMLQDTERYRECASQQFRHKSYTTRKSEQTWNTSPRDDDILGQVSVWNRSSRAHVNQQTELIFCCCDGHFHKAPAVLLLWWISPTHSECNTVHYLAWSSSEHAKVQGLNKAVMKPLRTSSLTSRSSNLQVALNFHTVIVLTHLTS